MVNSARDQLRQGSGGRQGGEEGEGQHPEGTAIPNAQRVSHFLRPARTRELEERARAAQDRIEELADLETGCQVAGCTADHHGHGFCAMHYQRWKRGGSDLAGKPNREDAIYSALRWGFDPAWHDGPVFKTEAERRKAWEARRAAIMAGWNGALGHRPWAFWQYEAERPDLYIGPPRTPGMIAEATRRSHEHDIERLTFLAANGHLTDEEVDTITEQAEEAAERIGTDREQKAPLSPDFGGDKLCVARLKTLRTHTPDNHGEER